MNMSDTMGLLEARILQRALSTVKTNIRETTDKLGAVKTDAVCSYLEKGGLLGDAVGALDTLHHEAVKASGDLSDIYELFMSGKPIPKPAMSDNLWRATSIEVNNILNKILDGAETK